MRAVVCRVEAASVRVDGQAVGRIGRGLLVYVGVLKGDSAREASWMAAKLVGLRVFNDEQEKMNLSVRDVNGGLLLIPNFTLAARTRKGTRPSYGDAAAPEEAGPLFDELARQCGSLVAAATGVFGARMLIDARCDGPVTLTVDSAG